MIEDLAARTCRWSLATGEILSAMREVHSTLQELGIRDPEADALCTLVSLIAERATPPDVVLSDDDDDRGDPDDPDPEPPLPVVLTPSTHTP